MIALPDSPYVSSPSASLRNLVERLVVEHAAGGITPATKDELSTLLDLISRRVYRSGVGFCWSPYHERQLLDLAEATDACGGLTFWNLRTNEAPGGDETEPVFVIGGPCSLHGIFFEPYLSRHAAEFKQTLADWAAAIDDEPTKRPRRRSLEK